MLAGKNDQVSREELETEELVGGENLHQECGYQLELIALKAAVKIKLPSFE